MTQIKNNTLLLQLIGSFLITLIFLLACDDTPNGPEEPPPGSRDYTWKVDTIANPFNSYNRIWGSSPENVWIVGPGGDLDLTIYHFDGDSWETDRISRPLSPLSVWGFGDNEIWVGGGDGKIWFYNGINWSESIRLENNDNIEEDIGFQEIWGDSPYNIFAAGYKGYEEKRIAVLARYNGIEWELKEFDSLITYNFLRIRRSNKQTNTYYIWADKDEQLTGDKLSIFEFRWDHDIKLVYEDGSRSSTASFIQLIDSEMYFVIGFKVYKYINNEFSEFLDIPFSNFGRQIFGRNKNDILLRMTDGIAHYNGSNIEYIYQFENPTSITDAVMFDDEVFILAFDITNGNDLIFHGTLN
jgi:hypothetical protein